MSWVWLLLAGFGSGLAASMGFGGGFLLLLFLAFFTDLSASQAGFVNLLFFIPIASLSLFFHKKNGLIDTPVLKPCILWGVVGIVIGFLLLPYLPQPLLRKIFGGLTLLMGIRICFFPKKNP